MAWSHDFLAALARPVITPIWRIETARFADGPYGGEYSAASAKGYGDEVIIGEGGCVIAGPKVSPFSWNSTVGQFTIPLAGSIRNLLRYFTRGSVVVVRMGFPGWKVDDFQVVAVGMVTDIVGRTESWTMVAKDMLSMLSSRIDNNRTQLQLFHGLSNDTTTLTANYTVGDATVTVGSTSTFQREVGSPGVIRLAGEFFLTYTGTTATTFTGCSAAGQFGTTAANVTSGGAVKGGALLSGHPLNIARRLLTSDTGATGNGAFDDYPAGWGWAIPHWHVDIDDIENWKDFVVKVSSGSYQWDYVQVDPIDDPGSWFQGWLAAAGLFPTVRQGLLTVRAGQRHAGSSAAPYMPDVEITDEDIEEVKINLFDPSTSAEYGSVDVISGTSNTATNDSLQTLPAAKVRTFDLSDRIWTNELQQRLDPSDRLTEMACRIPEAIHATCRGVRLAQLSPGDVVPFSCRRIYGRLRNTIDGYDARRVYVAQASTNFQRHRTQLLLLSYPTDEEAFPL